MTDTNDTPTPEEVDAAELLLEPHADEVLGSKLLKDGEHKPDGELGEDRHDHTDGELGEDRSD